MEERAERELANLRQHKYAAEVSGRTAFRAGLAEQDRGELFEALAGDPVYTNAIDQPVEVGPDSEYDQTVRK